MQTFKPLVILLLGVSSLEAGTVPSRDNTGWRPWWWKREGVRVEGDCAFRVNGDLNDPAPLFAVHGKFDWLLPNTDGVVFLKNGETFDMYCSNSFAAPFLNTTRISAQCLQRQYFLVQGLIYPFASFGCRDWPASTVRRTGRSCNGGTDLLEVGFEVHDDDADSDGFLHLMDICHDEYAEVTRYVHHVLHPTSINYQHSVMRPNFMEGDFFGSKNVGLIYTKKQQKSTFSYLLGMNASVYFNETIDVFLSRGHLAAKTDFIFGAAQRSTFWFVNVAPQWQSFNGGNWERVEFGVRQYVAQEALTTDCYTGTWGVSSLPDAAGVPQFLYLDLDENNNGLIPVPMLYFRVVIDRESRKGIVFVGVNNPHASRQQILEHYVVCPDIGGEIDWIPWAKESLEKGYSYACSVPDFIRVVKDLPLDELKTKGILGMKRKEITTTEFTTESSTTTYAPTNQTTSSINSTIIPTSSPIFTTDIPESSSITTTVIPAISPLITTVTSTISPITTTNIPTTTRTNTTTSPNITTTASRTTQSKPTTTILTTSPIPITTTTQSSSITISSTTNTKHQVKRF